MDGGVVASGAVAQQLNALHQIAVSERHAVEAGPQARQLRMGARHSGVDNRHDHGRIAGLVAERLVGTNELA